MIAFLEVNEIASIHDSYVDQFGGLVGIRDQGLLESAVFAPQATFGGELLHQDIFEMAAVLCHGIIKNHAFFDGNKRTGVFSAIIFLIYNEKYVRFEKDEIVLLAIGLATGEITQEDAAAFFKSKCK